MLSVARRIGLQAETTQPISQMGREVILLEPCLVVAKVSPLADKVRCETEIALANHVLRQHGPVVSPLLTADPGPHCHGDAIISFWKYHLPDSALTLSGQDANTAYSRLSPHLQSYVGALPDFRLPIRACQRVVQQSQIGYLNKSSIKLLRTEFETLDRLDFNPIDARNLLGDPHLRNIIQSENQLLWLDLKAACTGPLEWDLSALPRSSRHDACQPDLLVQLQRLRSACVIVWCALKKTPAPLEMEAIQIHFKLLTNQEKS